jgi:hypothetical protein
LSFAVKSKPIDLRTLHLRRVHRRCVRGYPLYVSLYDVEDEMTDRDLTNSWLQRARAEGTLDARSGAESNTAAQAFAVTSRDGWDPWEVWLRHIDQPRRHLAGRRLKLAA